MSNSEINPLKAFSRVASSTVSHVTRMRQETLFQDGELNAKTKVMAAMLWSVSVRCEPCLKFYAHKATELGATEKEIGEMLSIAPVMGACVGETWAAKAFSAAVTTDD
ncbi:MAG TPA: carboxymuconolactone decarboxylase family protein, partial [Gammaproteobacteria bacterium]|nr:carboxymuconolactone decarboxylase family protein [Gammaproteobacteria bacterium]